MGCYFCRHHILFSPFFLFAFNHYSYVFSLFFFFFDIEQPVKEEEKKITAIETKYFPGVYCHSFNFGISNHSQYILHNKYAKLQIEHTLFAYKSRMQLKSPGEKKKWRNCFDLWDRILSEMNSFLFNMDFSFWIHHLNASHILYIICGIVSNERLIWFFSYFLCSFKLNFVKLRGLRV